MDDCAQPGMKGREGKGRGGNFNTQPVSHLKWIISHLWISVSLFSTEKGVNVPSKTY